MKKLVLVGAVLLGAGVVLALADDKADGKKNLYQEYIEKYGAPGPENKLLEPLVGTWNAKVTCYMNSAQGPQTSNGTAVRKSILGGRFIEEQFDGKVGDRPFHGQGIVGYDRGQKRFEMMWIDSFDTAMLTFNGTYDSANQTWTFQNEGTCPITGKHVRMRDTLRIVNADEQKMDMFRQLGDEKEMKVMEITFTRQK